MVGRARQTRNPKMNAAVRIDPETGLKVFNTRAAKASEKITGKGYSVTADQKLKELPELPPGATFNAEEQAKYLAFKPLAHGQIPHKGAYQSLVKLQTHEFDPTRDIRIGPSGVLVWNSSKPELHRSLREYFASRMGDG